MVEEIFMRNNLLDDVAINNLDLIKSHEKSNISIDLLEKIKYLDSDKCERSIWIHPIENMNLQNLIRFFEITYKCGIVLDARIRKARKYPNKIANNTFGFLEFADSTSVTRALHLAARKVTVVDGIKFRIFKAGTGTFIYSKKTSKQKKLEAAKVSLPPVPYDTVNPRDIRGFVNRGRGRGGMKRGGMMRGKRRWWSKV